MHGEGVHVALVSIMEMDQAAGVCADVSSLRKQSVGRIVVVSLIDLSPCRVFA